MITETQMPEEAANARSHSWGNVDDCIRCVNCEIGIWSGHTEMCGG